MFTRRAGAWLAALTGACAAKLPEADLQCLLAHEQRTAERLFLEVEIESAGLSGTFDAVLITRPSPPAVRVQLLPLLGAPILDVAATPRQVDGVMYGDGAPTIWRGRSDDPAPAPMLFIGITLLEQHAALTRDRVLDADAESPPRLRLRGCFPGLTVSDAVLQRGRVVARTYDYGLARWCDRLGNDDGTVTAPGFALRACVREREAALDLDDATFVLAAPTSPASAR